MAICFGVSDFNSLEAQYAVNSRIKQHVPIDAATLQKARETLESSLAWNPRNSSAHENIALVHRMRLGLPYLSLADRQEALDLALKHILRSAELRPTSGYTYSIVAQVKQLRGERDAIFHKALSQAVQYGPWEPGVQDNVMEVGARAWDILTERERDAVRQTIRRALEVRPDETKDFLIARRWILPNCADLKVRIPDICE